MYVRWIGILTDTLQWQYLHKTFRLLKRQYSSLPTIIIFGFFHLDVSPCLIFFRTRFSYKPVYSLFVITHYVTAYKTIYMYYLKKSHDLLNGSWRYVTKVHDLISCHIMSYNKLATNQLVSKLYLFFIFFLFSFVVMEESQLLFQATHLSTLQDYDDFSNLWCSADGSGLAAANFSKKCLNQIFRQISLYFKWVNVVFFLIYQLFVFYIFEFHNIS